MSQSLGYENRYPRSGFVCSSQATAAMDGGVAAAVDGADASRVGAMSAPVPGTTIGVEPESILAASPRGSITTTAMEEEPVPADKEQLVEELQTLSAGQEPTSEARPQPTSMAVLHQARPPVGEAVPTLLQAIGQPEDPSFAPSLEPRGAPLPAGGRARSRPPSNGGSRRQHEEFIRHVHYWVYPPPSCAKPELEVGHT